MEAFEPRISPDNITHLLPGQIFVFGSNEAGEHGAGAALRALSWGAEWCVSEGLQGNTYAIPTKDMDIKTLPVNRIAQYVSRFVDFARARPDLTFLVTEIGCGLAGYKPEQIAPLFKDAAELENVWLPIRFWDSFKQKMQKVNRLERGWAGHFICSHKCLFRRNTLLTYGDINIVVSTVGLMLASENRTGTERYETIGHNRHYETKVFHAGTDEYQDADVSREVHIEGNCSIAELDAELEANEMHEAVVNEITERILKNERFDDSTQTYYEL